MIAIGIDEPCQLCLEEQKIGFDRFVALRFQIAHENTEESKRFSKVFVLEKGKDYFEHLEEAHADAIERFLFGGENIGV